MAHSHPSRSLSRALLLGAATALAPPFPAAAAPPAAGAAPPPAAAASPQELPINLEASKTDIDGRTNTLVFTDVVITQGGLRVQADHAHATGLNFANSHWSFEGKVRIEAEQRGSLRSDAATVEFRDNRIARATVTGKPAEFEQQRSDTGQMAHGHADQIVYDVNDGTVRLSEDAWLTDGQTEISGPLLVYNVRAQSMQAAAAAGTDQRVHIKITPPPAGAPEPAKADKSHPPPPPQP
jgi:lipopolysaccharide transport protein LptA